MSIFKIRSKTCQTDAQFCQNLYIDGLVQDIMKTHVRGFFDTDLHEVSWHFATHEAVRPSGF